MGRLFSTKRLPAISPLSFAPAVTCEAKYSVRFVCRANWISPLVRYSKLDNTDIVYGNIRWLKPWKVFTSDLDCQQEQLISIPAGPGQLLTGLTDAQTHAK